MKWYSVPTIASLSGKALAKLLVAVEAIDRGGEDLRWFW